MADSKTKNPQFLPNLFFHPALPVAAFLAASVVLTTSAHAVIVYDQAGQQTTAPSDDEGYQFVGAFDGGAAVVISPHLFLTAKHLQGDGSAPIHFQGTQYFSDSFQQVPGTDMVLFHTIDAMPTAGAPLYFNSVPAIPSEVGKSATIIGDGGPKSDPYIGTDSQPHGWNFTEVTQVNSWGSTAVDGVYTDDNTQFKYLGFAFQAAAGSSIYTAGDSGGGLFIQQNGTWKLAGINQGIDGYYTDSAGQNLINVAIYSTPGSGLYEPDPNGDGGFQLATDLQHGYASQITPAYAFLQSQILLATVPEPASLLLLSSIAFPLLTRRRKP